MAFVRKFLVLACLLSIYCLSINFSSGDRSLLASKYALDFQSKSPIASTIEKSDSHIHLHRFENIVHRSSFSFKRIIRLFPSSLKLLTSTPKDSVHICSACYIALTRYIFSTLQGSNLIFPFHYFW